MLNKISLLSLICIFCCYNFKKNFNQEDNKICWSSQRKLKWSDFTGIPDSTKTNYGAMVAGSVEITESYWEDEIPKFKVAAYFIKNESWTTVNDEYSLKHEQLHFDIHELFARKIRKSFDSLNCKKVKKIQDYQDKYTQLLNANIDMQALYDGKVYFNNQAQQQWSKKINNELKKLQKFQ